MRRCFSLAASELLRFAASSNRPRWNAYPTDCTCSIPTEKRKTLRSSKTFEEMTAQNPNFTLIPTLTGIEPSLGPTKKVTSIVKCSSVISSGLKDRSTTSRARREWSLQ